MSLKIHPLLAALLITGILFLVFALIRGCNQSKLQVSKFNKIDSLNNALLGEIAKNKRVSDSTTQDYQDSLEFVKGQYTLVKEQETRTSAELQDVTKANKILIAKHKLAEYTDTSAVTVPGEFVAECNECFGSLEKTTGLVERYKNDINNLQSNWDKQSQLYQKRFKELDAEKLGFYNKINILAKAQQEAIDKLKPHGQLYFSWGVLFGPLPKMTGIGFVYQTKYKIQYGLKGYFGVYGSMVEGQMNLPLSLKHK